MKIYYENKKSPLEFRYAETLASFVHMHKELELVHVIRGKAMAYADKNCYLLNDGDTFVAFPNQTHYYNVLNEGKFLLMIFTADIVFGCEKLLLDSVPDTNVVKGISNELPADFLNSMKCFTGDYNSVFTAGCLNIIMSTVLPKMKLSKINSDSYDTLYKIIKYCTDNYKTNLTLESVADALNISKYYVSRLINSKLSLNFNEYINNLRISEASNLLLKTDMKIADISEDVGFETIRSFNRVFRQLNGCSPSDYRECDKSVRKQI